MRLVFGRPLMIVLFAAFLAAPAPAQPAPEAPRFACLAGPKIEARPTSARAAAQKSALALDLMVKLAADGKGAVAFSPFGVAQVLATLHIGADKAMKAAIAKTLRLDAGSSTWALDVLRKEARLLSAIGAGANAPFTSADALFLNKGLKLAPGTEELVAAETGLTVRKLDFSKAEAIAEVNLWVKARTGGRIATVLEPGSDPSLVAVNAFAFKDCWRTPFDPAQTKAALFKLINGQNVERATMVLHETLAFRQKGRFAALEVPYADDRFVMTLVVTSDAPAAPGAFADTADLLAGEGMKPVSVRLSLPKFGAASEFDLLSLLSQAGLAPGLASKTQLAGFASGLSLSAIKQKTFILADETGTEAAAATAAIAMRGFDQSPMPVVFDKPFIYALRHRATGIILLMGYVADPDYVNPIEL